MWRGDKEAQVWSQRSWLEGLLWNLQHIFSARSCKLGKFKYLHLPQRRRESQPLKLLPALLLSQKADALGAGVWNGRRKPVALLASQLLRTPHARASQQAGN